MRVIERADKFKDSYSPMGYVYRIANNYCIDEYRKATRRVRLKNEQKQIVNTETLIEHNIDFLLEDAVSNNDLDLIYMKHIEQLDTKEIANLTGQSIKAAAESVRQAEHNLAEYIFE